MYLKFISLKTLHLSMILTGITFTSIVQANPSYYFDNTKDLKINYSSLAGKTVECDLARGNTEWQPLGVVQFIFDEAKIPNVKSIKMKELLLDGPEYSLEYEGDQATYTQSPAWIPLRETNNEVFIPRWIIMIPKNRRGTHLWNTSPHEFHLETDAEAGRYVQDYPTTEIRPNTEVRVEILGCTVKSY